MARNGEISVADGKRVLRKYWWLLPLCTVVMGTLGFVATRVLPKKYTSETTVLVEQPVVSSDYVKPVESDDLNMRLASMQAQVLSTPTLQGIIQKLNLYADQRGKTSMDDLIGQLQKAIKVKMLDPMPGSGGRAPGFHVEVSFADPDAAQKICTEITGVFIKQNQQKTLQQGQVTTEFMGQELQVAKAKLDEQDARLAQFKKKYLGTLPEEEQSNLGLLEGLNTQLAAATQAVNRAQEDKAINETLLNQQEANWNSSLTGGGVQSPDTLEQQLAYAQQQYSQMLSRYTPEYPDVVKLRTQIQELKARMAADAAAPKTPVAPSATAKVHEPAQITELRTRVKQDEMNIADLTKHQNQIQHDIQVMEARVQASPMVEQEYKELTRDHDTAQGIYNDLLRKQSDSSIAKDLVQQQESEVFRELDPPSYPSSPSFPKMILFLPGGLAAGLALGCGILYLLAMLDTAMYSERDVEASLKLPVLVSVPNLNAAN